MFWSIYCSCMSPKVQQKRAAIWCDNRNLHRFISANFLVDTISSGKEMNACHQFYHILITLRAAWEIFPIKKIQGFSTPLPSSYKDIVVSNVVKSPNLDLYKLTNFKHSHVHLYVTSGRHNAVTQWGSTLSLQFIYTWGCVDQFRVYIPKYMHDPALQMFALKFKQIQKGLKIVRRAQPSMCLLSAVYLMLHEIIACDNIFRSCSTVFGQKTAWRH